MVKTVKVTIEYENGEIRQIKGEEAEKWSDYCDSVSTLAYVHGLNPFDSDPIKWEIIKKGK